MLFKKVNNNYLPPAITYSIFKFLKIAPKMFFAVGLSIPGSIPR